MTKNGKYSFAITSKKALTKATAAFYFNEFLREVRKNGLTITGEDYPAVRRGIENIAFGNTMTVGTSGTHDIDFIERDGFVCERGLKPIYDLVEDWNIIVKKLAEYVDSKALRTLRGTKITFHAGFVMVGDEIIPNEDFAKIVARLKI